MSVYTQWHNVLEASAVTVWGKIIPLLSVVFYYVHTAGKVREKQESVVSNTAHNVWLHEKWAHGLSAIQPFSSCHGLNASSVSWCVYFIRIKINGNYYILSFEKLKLQWWIVIMSDIFHPCPSKRGTIRKSNTTRSTHLKPQQVPWKQNCEGSVWDAIHVDSLLESCHNLARLWIQQKVLNAAVYPHILNLRLGGTGGAGSWVTPLSAWWTRVRLWWLIYARFSPVQPAGHFATVAEKLFNAEKLICKISNTPMCNDSGRVIVPLNWRSCQSRLCTAAAETHDPGEVAASPLPVYSQTLFAVLNPPPPDGFHVCFLSQKFPTKQTAKCAWVSPR